MTKQETAAYMKAYCQSHKAERAEYNKLWYAKNKTRLRAKQKAYNSANRDDRAAYDRKYNLLNKELCAAKHKVRRRARKAEIAAYDAAYREAHKTEVAAWNAAYRKAHPDKIADNSALRRARKRGASVEKVSRALVYERDGGYCHICGKKVNPKKWHIDHIIPLARGGEHSYKNVAVSHPKCNLSKGAKSGGQLRLH